MTRLVVASQMSGAGRLSDLCCHIVVCCAVAMRQENMLWFKAPPKIYFKRGSLDLGLAELSGL